MTGQFLRADTFRYKRLGSHSRKLAKWRRPRGKHNKLRLKRAGHPVCPGIGFGSMKKTAGKINGMIPKVISNLMDISNLTKENIAIISKRLGAKKKIEVIKKLEEKQIKILNLGAKK